MKKSFENWTDVLQNSLNEFWNQFVEALPSIIGAIVIIILGIIIAKILRYITEKVVGKTKFSELSIIASFKKKKEESTVENDVSRIASTFVYWVVVLFFLVIASESLGWEVVSLEIGNIFRYLPRLFAAIIILVIGLYIAGAIRNAIKTTFKSLGLKGYDIIASIAYFIIMLFLGITALNQAGINTDVISNNITLLLGAILFAFALAFGLGSRELIENFLSSTYAKHNLKIGQEIRINNLTGTVVALDSVSMTLKTSDSNLIIPIKRILETEYEILTKKV